MLDGDGAHVVHDLLQRGVANFGDGVAEDDAKRRTDRATGTALQDGGEFVGKLADIVGCAFGPAHAHISSRGG